MPGEERFFVSDHVGIPSPRPGSLFARAKSNQKHAQEGDTFDCVPLLRTTPRNDIFKGAPPPRQRGYPPSRLEGLAAPQRHGTAPPRRGVLRGLPPPIPPETSVGAKTIPLQKATRPWGENQIDQDENRLSCGQRNDGAAPLDESIPLTANL